MKLKYEYTLDYAWDAFCRNAVGGKGKIYTPFGTLDSFALATLRTHYKIQVISQNERGTTYSMDLYE